MIFKFDTFTSRSMFHASPFVCRALRLDQMEFDSALLQMYSLCVKPSLVTKMSKARKMTKNHYYRDDPAFLILQILFIVLTTSAYGATFGQSLLHVLRCCFYDVLVIYYLCGLLFSSLIWIITSNFLIDRSQNNDVSGETEWRYSFDVHCNGYFIYFMLTKVIQFILIPFLYSPHSFVSQILANCLFCFGAATYFYNIFLGYLELPMLTQQQRLMYPVSLITILLLLITLLSHLNLTVWSINSYWLTNELVD